MTSQEALKILKNGWIEVYQIKANDEESTKENIKAQEAYAYIVELLKQKDETILDKIRNEINAMPTDYCGGYIGLDKKEVLQVIDKYREESEGEE